MKYCPKCGNEMADGATFCGNCGAKLGAEQKGSVLAVVLRTLALVLSICGFLTGIFIIGLVLDIIAIVLAAISLKLGGKNGKAISAITIAGLSLVLCAGIFIADSGLRFGDITLTDDTITYGAEDYSSELRSHIETEYTYRITDTNIDTSSLGEYYVEIVYSKDGQDKTKRFDVKVVDKTPPEIDFTRRDAEGTVYAYLNDEDSLREVITLTDNCDGAIAATAENVKIEDVIFSAAGEYHGSVTFSDSAGNSATRSVTVRITEPEITLRDYVIHYIAIEDVKISDSLDEISLRKMAGDSIFYGKFLYLTSLHYTYSFGNEVGEDGAHFSQNINFDENFTVLEERRSGTLLQQTLKSAEIYNKHKAWMEAPTGSGYSIRPTLDIFNEFEEDPIVKELGGFPYFLGKTPEDLESVMVDLKALTVVK